MKNPLDIALIRVLGLYGAMFVGVFGIHIHNAPIDIHTKTHSWNELQETNLTKQHYDYSCGAASLSTILSFYYGLDASSERDILSAILESKGVKINASSEQEILAMAKKIEEDEKLRTDMRISFYDLAEYAKKRGFKALALGLDMNGLKELKIPVIVYINVRDMEHFSVFKGIHGGFVHLGDPSFGNIKISIGRFEQMFYSRKSTKYPGKVLAFIPNKSAPIQENTPQETSTNINQDFMKTIDTSALIYELILDDAR